MFELTNAQRPCFGLAPVDGRWTRLELKPSPYDTHTTYAYLDGSTLRKYIAVGEDRYVESEISEQVSGDGLLLPKTAKGKPVPLTATTLEKRTGTGMCLSWYRRKNRNYIDLFSNTSQKCWYSSNYEPIVGDFDFPRWVEGWCAETTPEDLTGIAAFAAAPRCHQKFREGDVFRFQINRRLYGYGRILLDYAAMRRRKEPFWDILMGKPLVCSVYHIATERADVTLRELEGLPSLPSVHMMDNRLFYGDFQIIGNLPIGEREDYPILYGGSLSSSREVLLQCGRLYRRKEQEAALFRGFTNNTIGFDLGFSLPVLRQCIEAGSNEPYWTQDIWQVNRDLRNPKFRAKLEQVCRQFSLEPSHLIP